MFRSQSFALGEGEHRRRLDEGRSLRKRKGREEPPGRISRPQKRGRKRPHRDSSASPPPLRPPPLIFGLRLPADCLLRKELEEIRAKLDAAFPHFRPEQFVSLTRHGVAKSLTGPLYTSTFLLTLSETFVHRDMEIGEVFIKLMAVLAHAFTSMMQKLDGPLSEIAGSICCLHSGLLRPISSPFRALTHFSIKQYCEDLVARLLSDESIDLREAKIYLRHIRRPAFGGRRRERVTHRAQRRYACRELDTKSWARMKQSLIDPMAESVRRKMPDYAANYCLPLALIWSEFLCSEPSQSQVICFRNNPRKRVVEAEKLIVAAGFGGSAGPFPLHAVPDFQKALEKRHGAGTVNIQVLRDDSTPITNFGPLSATKKLKIFVDTTEEHCYVVKNVRGFLSHHLSDKSKTLFCDACSRTYRAEKAHNCSETENCPACNFSECPNRDATKMISQRVRCDRCKLYLYHEECAKFHKKLPCKAREMCDVCKGVKKGNHSKTCCKSFCVTCRDFFDPFTHVCLLKPDKKALKIPSGKVPKLWMADIESSADPETGEQFPYLLILQSPRIRNGPSVDSDGNDLGFWLEEEYDEIVFQGPNCVDEYVKTICEETGSKLRNSYTIFQNLSYDGILLMKSYLKRSSSVRRPLFRGSSLLTFQSRVGGVVYLDSTSYWGKIPLSRIPRLFDFPVLNKGYFPFSLVGKTGIFRQGMVRFPPRQLFGCEHMSQSGRHEFELWHSRESSRYEREELDYVIEEHLMLYCQIDVAILRVGFLRFLSATRAIFGQMSPLQWPTMSSYSFSVFTSQYLSHDVALLPDNGYQSSSSKESIAWMSWECRRRGLRRLRHARNSHEARVFGYRIDGHAIDPESGVRFLMAYHGCAYHGCDRCGAVGARRSKKDEDRLGWTRLMDDALGRECNGQPTGYGVLQYVSRWSCQVKEEMRTNPEMKKFIWEYKRGMLCDGMRFRDALAGGWPHLLTLWWKDEPLWFISGRVEVGAHRFTGTKDRALLCHDVTSLFPSTQASVRGEKFPVGEPEILIGIEVGEKFKDVQAAILQGELFGVLRLEVDPPPRALWPALPYRHEKRLYFPICRLCCERKSGDSCTCTKAERRMRLVVCSTDLALALKQGFKIHRVFEVWHWAKRSPDVMRAYVVRLIRQKCYSSGWPDDAESESQRQAYCEKLRKNLGLEIEPEKFRKNVSLRSFVKVVVNSLWQGFDARLGLSLPLDSHRCVFRGFAAKRPDPGSKDFFTNTDELLRLDMDPDVEIQDVVDIGKQIYVSSKPINVTHPLGKSALSLAIFVASHARGVLQAKMDQLGQRLYYTDTG